jgi:MFS superfamily sulfate permease-like transporter
MKENLLSHWRNDLSAGLVVFLVAVPLCLGIALASGAPIFSGIIAGMVGGIVVTLYSRSQLGVSGPAAGLVVLVLAGIDQIGSFEGFLLAIVFAGLVQILLGIFKAGIIGYYLPSSVIKGMLSGIGLILILKQIPHAFGYDADPEGEFEFFQPDGHTTFSELFYMLEGITPGAIVISIIGLLILILWERPFIKNLGFTHVLSGPLMVVLVGIVLNLVFQSNSFLYLSEEHMVNIPEVNSLGEYFGLFMTPDWSQITNQYVYIFAVTIALVASLETLLCVEATDKMDPHRHITPTNRELVAQGIGNTVSGLIGGLPVTQVIVRSSANIQSGGKTRFSALFHGILILISSIAIPNLLNLIPLASLAAILLVVGYKLVSPAVIRAMYRTGQAQFYSFLVTLLGIVFTDLLFGILLGLVVAFMFILWNNYRTPYHFDPDAVEQGKPIRIELSEDVSFLNKAGIIKAFRLIPDHTHVILDASRTRTIHWDVLEAIEDYKLNAQSQGIKLELIGFPRDDDHNPEKAFQSHLKSEQT